MKSPKPKHAIYYSVVLLQCLSGASLWGVDFAGGTGTQEDPYQIMTAEHLIAIGANPELQDKHFVLLTDLDLDPKLPGRQVFNDALIAQDQREGAGTHGGGSFSGSLDGQGHTISNLHIEARHGYTTGLFGMLRGLAKDLNLIDVVISGSRCGAIAGWVSDGLILRCQVSGRISGHDYAGGVVGFNADGQLVRCRPK